MLLFLETEREGHRSRTEIQVSSGLEDQTCRVLPARHDIATSAVMPLVCIPDPALFFSLSPVFALQARITCKARITSRGQQGGEMKWEKGREAESMQPAQMVIEYADMRYCAELTTSAYSTPKYQTPLNRL